LWILVYDERTNSQEIKLTSIKLRQEDFDKIDHYIRGVANDNEKKYVESLFIEGDDNLYLRNCLEKDWEYLLKESTSSGVDLNPLLDRIHHIIRKKETVKRQKFPQKIMRIYLRVAAILLIPLLVASILIYHYQSDRYESAAGKNAISVIYAPMGSRVSFTLPDGTTGMLNSGSKLRYSLPFSKNRQIELAGEAWFEVKHDEKHPFEISSGKSIIKVLGTIFNLSAYPEENYIELVLKQGKVEFIDSKRKQKVLILPSERLVYQNGETSKSIVDPTKYNAWTEGMLVFRGDPMAEVARRIERWYNVKINIASRELEKYSFRATFQDDKLEDVLRFLTMTSPISYKISPPQILEDGTFKKEEVTIYRNNQ
jgi:transmembrane sensor